MAMRKYCKRAVAVKAGKKFEVMDLLRLGVPPERVLLMGMLKDVQEARARLRRANRKTA